MGGVKKVRFKLQFLGCDIRDLADSYIRAQSEEARDEERRLVEHVGPSVRDAGCMQKAAFLAFCRWKSPRLLPRAFENPADRVEEATTLAFATRDEALGVGILMVLDGVGLPMASVLLHFGHRDPFPILDFRALESLGVKQRSSYTFDFWWQYVHACRNLAAKYKVDMRTLDRALWQYSAEKD